MIRNYLKIARRTLWKQKSITAINVLGLAAGMAVCLLVGLLFWDQLTHDDFHPGADRIYRVTTTWDDDRYATSSAGLAPALREGVTGVETATRMRRSSGNVVHDNHSYNTRSLYAEPSFFDVFGFDLEAGDPAQALSKPSAAVLTQGFARHLFGDSDPIGKSIQLAEGRTLVVTGVIHREAYRSHLPFDALYSFATLDQTGSNELGEWRSRSYNYLRLEENRSVADIEASLRQIRRQHLPPETNDEARGPSFELQSLSEIPLGPSLHNDIAEGMLPRVVGYFLAGLALLVLLAAAFNYVNLSLARSLNRAREVGVRKTVGAHAHQIMGQFVAEAVITALLSLFLAALALQALVPAFNGLFVVRTTGWQIGLEPGLSLYGAFLLFAAVIGGAAGLYPAWHLSKFQPAPMLKTGVQADVPGFNYMTPRRWLVVLQFAVAFVISVSAALVFEQAHHMAEGHEYPFQFENLIRVRLQDASYGPFQQAARRSTEIQRVGAASVIPTGVGAHPYTVGSEFLPDSTSATYYSLDYEAIQLLKLPFVAKYEFTEARFETGRTVLIDETAVQHFGFTSPQQALGESITLAHSGFGEKWDVQIVGIVQNFAVSAFGGRQGRDPEVDPVVFHYNPDLFREALAQVDAGEKHAALNALKEVWSEFDEANVFNGGYAKDYLWKREGAPLLAVGWLLGAVAALAILISSLGLLGIATYTVETRTREIGIRKALGATVERVVARVSKDFLWLIGTAVVLGLPVAWWINRLWLQNYDYRIDLGVGPFLISAVGLLALAFLTIASQTVRAARIDPATTLRDE